MQGYDIIGDIHGYATALRTMLDRLGYTEIHGCYRHPTRKVIFLGDFIDRGPEIRETLQIVRPMVEGESALAVMGNHEYNAICYHTPDGNGDFLRSHTEANGKNKKQHQATLDQFEPYWDEWTNHLAWFKTLPLFLECDGLRLVHACWDEESIDVLGKATAMQSRELLFKSADHGNDEYRAVDVLLKGKELRLPAGYSFVDKEGTSRGKIRLKWWLGPEGATYRNRCLPESGTVPDFPVPDQEWPSMGSPYALSEKPVFMGHYWLPPAAPELLAPNIACLDYSIAKGGFLCAYRWNGERMLRPGSFVTVE